MANGRYNLRLLDHSNEGSNFEVQTGAVTAVSLPGLLTQIGTFRGAVDGITDGTIQKESLKVFDTPLGNTPPVSDVSHRERKWLVRYEDTTAFFDDPVNAIPNEAFGRVYTFSIPCADPAGKLLANSDMADLADAAIAAFVTAFEAMGRSPAGGAVNVLSIELVGRNL